MLILRIEGNNINDELIINLNSGKIKKAALVNNSLEVQETQFFDGEGHSESIVLQPSELRWREYSDEK